MAEKKETDSITMGSLSTIPTSSLKNSSEEKSVNSNPSFAVSSEISDKTIETPSTHTNTLTGFLDQFKAATPPIKQSASSLKKFTTLKKSPAKGVPKQALDSISPLDISPNRPSNGVENATSPEPVSQLNATSPKVLVPISVVPKQLTERPGPPKMPPNVAGFKKAPFKGFAKLPKGGSSFPKASIVPPKISTPVVKEDVEIKPTLELADSIESVEPLDDYIIDDIIDPGDFTFDDADLEISKLEESIKYEEV
eukprot:TRINITY_DN4901_c0_g1_i2.p1 TRINITY_DN4901_c0_g1~~TRINITY_DN4901_c0_g1_i2.p1  ORF type:complete len:253 (-),score=70.08 TRINITY_DN4901_c0_g1_i2:381-1139(-)